MQPEAVLTKQCNSCKEVKPLAAFHKSRRTADGFRPNCKACRSPERNSYRNIEKERQRGREYRERHKERLRNDKNAYRNAHPESRRNSMLKCTYGITLDDYQQLFDSQSGGCAICGRPDSGCKGGPLQVDHDHETDEVRGLLCFRCNWGVAFIESEKFASAIHYLNRPPARGVLGQKE